MNSKSVASLPVILVSIFAFSTLSASSALGSCKKGDCTNGHGTYIYPDGSTYVGQWRDQQFDGQGTFTYSDGCVYIGEWKKNQRSGKGSFSRPNGAKYQGQWKNDMFDGEGTYFYPDGSLYVGHWENNMRTGPGIYTAANRHQYQGNWKNGKLVGKVLLITSDGRKFNGFFDKEGKLIGDFTPLATPKYTAKAEPKPKTKRWSDIKNHKNEDIKKEKTPKSVSVSPKQKPKSSGKMTPSPPPASSPVTIKTKPKQSIESVASQKDESPQETDAADKPAAVPSDSPNQLTNRFGMTFVLLPPGTYLMGSPESEAGRYENETQHQVVLSDGFYMQSTEVTQGQWRTLMGNNPSFFSGCGDDCPVEQVSWDDAQQFIWRLNQLDGAEKYRLPTEAEWEYACRAGSGDAFASGQISSLACENDSDLIEHAWFCGNAAKSTHPVSQKKPNAWGLYDMHGNVAELIHDWFGEYPPEQIVDPKGPASGIDHPVRGGGWDSEARHCRSACRGALSASQKINAVGFRLVMTP
jgi:formylglycine-generating enzyme required for sulfatase activity